MTRDTGVWRELLRRANLCFPGVGVGECGRAATNRLYTAHTFRSNTTSETLSTLRRPHWERLEKGQFLPCARKRKKPEDTLGEGCIVLEAHVPELTPYQGEMLKLAKARIAEVWHPASKAPSARLVDSARHELLEGLGGIKAVRAPREGFRRICMVARAPRERERALGRTRTASMTTTITIS